jgi:GMP synthase PP-ATPase subunit
MEDYLLREIRKIGELLSALLQKMGMLRKAEEQKMLYATARMELMEELKLNIDTLLEGENIVDTLKNEYGFNHEELGKFAELLFELVGAAEEQETRMSIASRIIEIYKYLDKNEPTFSWSRYYILKELGNYL